MQNRFAHLIPQGAQQQAALVPLPGYEPPPPDPFKVRDQQLQEEAAAFAREDQAFQRAEREEKRRSQAGGLSNEQFDNESTLRAQFNALPATKDYATILQPLSAAYKAADTKAGDLNLIYAFGKIMDPASVVREGEMVMVQGTGTVQDRLAGLMSEITGEGRLQPKTRTAILSELRNRGQQAATAYNAERERYKGLASRYGMPGDAIVGAHLGAGFQQAEADFLRRPIRNLDGSLGAAPTSPRREPAGPGDIGFAGASPAGNPLTPDQQQRYDDFVRENPNISPPELRAFMRGIGVQGDINAEQILEAAKSGTGFSSAKSAQTGLAPEQKAEIDQRLRTQNEFDSFAVGVANTGTLGFNDEIQAGLRAVGDAFQGEGSFLDRYNRNIGVERGYEEALRQRDPLSSLAGQLAGGFVLPTFGATTPGRLAAVGGGYGAAYGAGSGEGVTDRLIGAATGGTVGAGAGATFGLIGNHIAARGGGGGGGGGRSAEVVAAATRQRLPLVVPDFREGARSTYGFLESMPIAGGVVRADLTPGVQALERRVGEVGGTGSNIGRTAVGQTLQDAGRRFIARSRTVRDRLYDRAETLSGGAQISPQNALQTLDRNIAELSQTPQANATKLDILQRLRADMVDDTGSLRQLPVTAARDLRTAMRDELNAAGLRASDAERRVMQVIDDLNGDITAGLRGQPGASRAYARADRFNRERAQMIDDVVSRFVGRRDMPMSAEKTAGVVENMANPQGGDANRLGRMFNALQPVERADAAATIISTVGRRGAADGENAFSPALFFSQIQKYSPEARRVIWGQTGAADLADLATFAEARGAVMGRMNNSRSGQVSNWYNSLLGVLGGTGAGAGLGAMAGVGSGVGGGTVAAAIGGTYLTAKALSNRYVVRVLADATRARSQGQQRAITRRLGVIAAREPALSAEIIPLQRALESGIAPRAAAEQENDRP